MGMDLILAVNASAAYKVLVTGGNTGTLSIVGLTTTETVAIQIPRVESPSDDNDDHWTPLKQDGEAFVLSADNNARRLPVTLLIRVVKAAGVSGNKYGVRWS